MNLPPNTQAILMLTARFSRSAPGAVKPLGPVEWGRFALWLKDFLPDLPRDASTSWLSPVVPTDISDGKLAHLDGLNLSRAWMLAGIISSLPAADSRIPALETAVNEHRETGLQAVSDEHYSVAHWIGSFAVYLTTRRGTTSA